MSDSLQDRREALKPCPFCGESAEIEHRDNGLFYVCCDGCLSQTYSRLEDNAIAAWNRRSGDSQSQESGWVDVNERLPDDCQEVLLWCVAYERGEDDDGNYREQEVSQVCMGRCVRDSSGIAYLENYASPFAGSEWVTHWQPLPAAPSSPKEQK